MKAPCQWESPSHKQVECVRIDVAGEFSARNIIVLARRVNEFCYLCVGEIW